MKKIGLDFYFRSTFSALPAVTGTITLKHIFSNEKSPYQIDEGYDHFIHMTTSQVFNCQNKHYEKICHFEKLAAANKIAAIKINRFNAAIVPLVFCHRFCTEYYN